MSIEEIKNKIDGIKVNSEYVDKNLKKYRQDLLEYCGKYFEQKIKELIEQQVKFESSITNKLGDRLKSLITDMSKMQSDSTTIISELFKKFEFMIPQYKYNGTSGMLETNHWNSIFKEELKEVFKFASGQVAILLSCYGYFISSISDGWRIDNNKMRFKTIEFDDYIEKLLLKCAGSQAQLILDDKKIQKLAKEIEDLNASNAWDNYFK